jgi:glycosyltransferase involved in cell wall biosynthesis
MRIVEIATNDLRGGAARSAYRLHQGLRRAGIDATMLVRWKQSNDDSVRALDEHWCDPALLERERALRQRWVRENRTDFSDTLFSLGSPSISLVQHPLVVAADVVHLHWVANFLGPASFEQLARLDKPIVWTLHDEWGYTGGCHYRNGCDQCFSRCSECPQLREDPLGLVPTLFDERIIAWRRANLTVVGPSRWIADCARRSAILGRHPQRVIPYGLDTSTFRPASADERRRFRDFHDIPHDAVVLAFGVDRVGERRKGYEHLSAALELAARRLRNVVILRFGDASGTRTPSLPTVDLGMLHDDRSLALAYGASDCFVLPTLEDNLPNGVLESMACATPVIAYATGGVPDLVDSTRHGLLVPTGDMAALAEALVDAASDAKRLRTWGRDARALVESEHTLERQAARYVGLYASVLRRTAEAA